MDIIFGWLIEMRLLKVTFPKNNFPYLSLYFYYINSCQKHPKKTINIIIKSQLKIKIFKYIQHQTMATFIHVLFLLLVAILIQVSSCPDSSCCLAGERWSITNGICVACSPTGCNRCDVADLCIECIAAGFTVSVTSGVGCVACPALLNCDQCDQANKCTSCSPTFSKIRSIDDGCCAAGKSWSVTAGVGCVDCGVPNCNQCDIASVCSQCSSAGMTPSITVGVGCVFCFSLLNCQRCDVENVCTICYDDFTMSSSSTVGCVSCLPSLNCLRCDATDKCALCKPTFSLLPGNADGCCLAGQTFSTNAGIGCISCPISNCNRCDSPNVCALCNSGFILNGDICSSLFASSQPFKTEYIIAIVFSILAAAVIGLLIILLCKKASAKVIQPIAAQPAQPENMMPKRIQINIDQIENDTKGVHIIEMQQIEGVSQAIMHNK